MDFQLTKREEILVNFLINVGNFAIDKESLFNQMLNCYIGQNYNLLKESENWKRLNEMLERKNMQKIDILLSEV